jgi:hypothetical protein
MQLGNTAGLGIDYIETPRIRKHLATIEELRGTHGRSDSDIMILSGPPGSGKTTLLDHFDKRYRASSDQTGDISPIVFARCPERSTFKQLAATILGSLNVPVSVRATENEMTRQIIVQLNGQRTQLLVLHDMNRLVGDRKVYSGSNVITDLCEDGRTPIIIAGLTEVERFVKGNKSLRRRIMAHITLEPYDWSKGEDRTELIGLTMMLAQSWRYPPKFKVDEEMVHRLAWAHGGLIGNIVQHMKRTEKAVAIQLRAGDKRPAEIYPADLAETYQSMRAKDQSFAGFEGDDDPFDPDVLPPSQFAVASLFE